MGEHNPQSPCEHSVLWNLETVPVELLWPIFLSPVLMLDSIN